MSPNPSLSPEFQALSDEAGRDVDAMSAAANLLDNIGNKVQQAAGDRQASLDLAQQLKTGKDALAAAVVRNTPADPNSPNPPPAAGTPAAQHGARPGTQGQRKAP